MYYLGMWELEERESEAQDHAKLHSEIQTSQEAHDGSVRGVPEQKLREITRG